MAAATSGPTGTPSISSTPKESSQLASGAALQANSVALDKLSKKTSVVVNSTALLERELSKGTTNNLEGLLSAVQFALLELDAASPKGASKGQKADS